MNKGASPRSRFLSPGWLMFGSALLCVVLVPIVHATMQYSSERSERHRQLSEMTESERLKIQHAFTEFQKLTPQEQDSFRELDRRLNHEDIALKGTLADYQAFLSSLSAVERSEIDRAKSNRERLNEIEQIQKERSERQQQLEAGYSMFEEQYRSDDSRHHGEVFSAKDMDAVADVIGPRLPTGSREKMGLDSKVGVARFALTVAAAFDAWKPRPPAMNRELIDDDLMQEIIAAIQNEEIREELEHAEREDARRKFFGYTFRTVFRELRKTTPETPLLYKFLETLEPEQKDELMSMDPSSMYRDLVRMYREKNPTELSKALDELFRESRPYFDLMRRNGRSGGPGRGGPDGRGRGGSGEERRPNREGERTSPDEPGAFIERRRERGFREGDGGERVGNRDRSDEPNRSGSE